MANDREKLVEKARVEYGIANAENLSDEQLKSEIKSLDEQKTSTQKEANKDK